MVQTYSDLSEAFMEHGHQQLGQHNNHHYVIRAYDHGTDKRAQLLCVADTGDEECNMRQRENVPEQSVASSHKPVAQKKRFRNTPAVVWHNHLAHECDDIT